MSVYTISHCVTNAEYKDCMTLMSLFISRIDLKIAIDSDGVAEEIYKKIDSDYKFDFTSLMNIIINCKKYEIINCNSTNKEDIFFEICKNTVGEHNIVIHSKQDYSDLEFINHNKIKYKGVDIFVYTINEILYNLSSIPMSVTNIGNVTSSVISESGVINHVKL